VPYLFFAVFGACTSPLLQAAEEYCHRVGIESSYRIMHQGHAKTTSRNPALRWLLVAIAFLVVQPLGLVQVADPAHHTPKIITVHPVHS
jgi:hypothetical protein